MKKFNFIKAFSLIIVLILLLTITGCDFMNKTTKITVATYNVQCLSYNTQITDIAEEIKTINPDIIGIQELDNNTNRCGGSYQLKQLANECGYEYYYYTKTIDFDGGEYGHGIMSKYPIFDSQSIPFTAQDSENRCFSKSIIKIDNKEIAFYNTHLDFMSNIQPKQFSELIEIAQYDEYAIITGDMNCAPSGYKSCLENKNFISLNGGKEFSNFINTCPEGESSNLPIDNIIISSSFNYITCDENNTGLYVNITNNSDHNMLYTYLEF